MNAFPKLTHRSSGTYLLVALLSSCSLAPWHSDKQAPPLPTPTPVVEAPPALPVPEATHRFLLPEDGSTVLGDVITVELSKDDTLPDIARRFDVGYEEIVRANPGVDPWLPGAGRRVVVPTQFVLPNAPRTGIVINVAAMRVFYFPKREAGKPAVVYTYPIGIGKVGWKTPEGTTRVTAKRKDPVWRPSVQLRKDKADEGDPVDAVVPAGPDNPLGKFEFVLGWPSYLIHGTNKPYGVGLRSSHGCVRLYPEDIEQLFSMTPIGTPVTVVNQPFVFGWRDNKLYLQPYTVLEDDPRNWQKAQKTLLAKSLSKQIGKDLKQKSLELDWEAVSEVTHRPRGLPVAVAGEAGTVDSVVASARQVANRLPDGSNWSGDDGTADAAGVQQLLSEQEPGPDAVPASSKTDKSGT